MAAPGVNNVQTGTFGSSTSPSYDAGSGLNRKLVVITAADDTSDRVTGITYNGVSMSLIRRVVGGRETIEIWELDSPASGSNTLAITTNDSEDFAYTALYLTDAATGHNADAGASGDSASPNVDITTTVDDCLIIAGFANDSSGASSPNSGETEIADFTFVSSRLAVNTFEKTTAGSENMGASMSDDDWSAVAAAFEFVGNIAPGAPTLETADDTETSDTTPALDFNAVDSDSDDIVYQIQIDQDSGFGSPDIDAVSDTDSGFSNVDTPADTSPFNSGDTVRYTVQTARALGTHYWRVRAKDPSGSNTWGNWSAIRAFHVFKTDREITSTTLSSLPTTSAHQYGSAFSSAGYDEFDDDDAGRISETGDATNFPYFIQKTQLSDNPFIVTANVQVDKETSVVNPKVANHQQWNTSSATTLSNSFTVASNSNRVLMVAIMLMSNTAVSSVSYGGNSLTKEGHTRGFGGRVEWWYLVNPPTGSNTLEVNISSNDYFIVSAVDVYDASQDSNPIDASNGQYVEGTQDFNVTVTTTVADTLLLSAVAVGGSNERQVPDSPMVELWDVNGAAFHGGAGGEQDATASGNHDVGWTNSVTFGSDVAHRVVAIKGASVSASIKLEVWNDTLSQWDSLDTETSPTANTDFTLTGTKSTGYSDYVDASNWIVARVVADYTPTVTLRVDQFTISLSASTETISHTTDALATAVSTLSHTTDSLLQAEATASHTIDSLVQAESTLSHTADAFASGANQLVHNTDALLLEASELTHSTDAYSILVQELTQTVDTLLNKPVEKTHTTDAAIKEVDITIEHSTDTIKQSELQAQHTTDTLLQSTDTKTHTTDTKLVIWHFSGWSDIWSWTVTAPVIKHYTDALKYVVSTLAQTVDSLIQRAYELSHTTDALKQKEAEASHTTDTILQKEASLDHTTDVLLQDVFEKNHTIDALKQSMFDKTHTADSYLQTSSELSHSIDALLLEVVTVDHSTDALLQDQFEASHTTDALKQATDTLTHIIDSLKRKAFEVAQTVDTLLQKALTAEHSTDALVQKEQEASHTTDSNVQRFGLLVHSTDADLLGDVDTYHNTDALLQSIFERSHTTDSLKQTINELSHDTDTLVRKAFELSHSTDALILKTFTKENSYDALIRKAFEVDHTTDTVLRDQGEVSHSIDALIYETKEVDHSTDAMLNLPVYISHTIDTYKAKTQEVSHSTDAELVKTYRVNHTVDALILRRTSRGRPTHLSTRRSHARMVYKRARTHLKQLRKKVKLKLRKR